MIQIIKDVTDINVGDKDLVGEARELCTVATPGQWKRHDTADYAEIHNGDTWGKALSPIALVGYTEDADFIVRSRTLIPELCDALKKAQAEIERLGEARKWTDAEYDTPDIGQAVLLYLPDKETDQIRVGEYLGEGDYRIGNRLYRGMEIDAWMLLPAPPKIGGIV